MRLAIRKGGMYGEGQHRVWAATRSYSLPQPCFNEKANNTRVLQAVVTRIIKRVLGPKE